MKRKIEVQMTGLLLLSALILTLSSNAIAEQKNLDKRDMVIWYNKPADKVWLDGLFIGNGYMGGNVFGESA